MTFGLPFRSHFPFFSGKTGNLQTRLPSHACHVLTRSTLRKKSPFPVHFPLYFRVSSGTPPGTCFSRVPVPIYYRRVLFGTPPGIPKRPSSSPSGDIFRTSLLDRSLNAFSSSFGSLWAPFDSLSAPFWDPSAPIWLPFGSLRLPSAPFWRHSVAHKRYRTQSSL